MKIKVYLFAITVMSAFGLQAQTIMNIHQSNGTVLQIPLNTIDSITYTITNPGNLATITTAATTSITGSTAVSGGNVSNDGGTLVTQRGICYSTSPSPTTANTTILSGNGTGSFTINLTGLTANTTYYVRAYATNSAGTAYGNQVSFATGGISNPGAGVTFDGYTYSSIVLGNGQEWMAENLRTTVYANGDTIPNITDPNQWPILSSGSWAYFNNDSQYEIPYGKLYNWYTVVDSRNVCPSGWHIPSNTEWTDLIVYLGGLDFAGGKMKSTGSQYWWSPNQGATNESGFSALPGGLRNSDGAFGNVGMEGYWWSSTESTTTSNAWSIYLDFNSVDVDMVNFLIKEIGVSVRCLRN
jgi:uncharacterized protein (TIGR02145 family)